MESVGDVDIAKVGVLLVAELFVLALNAERKGCEVIR